MGELLVIANFRIEVISPALTWKGKKGGKETIKKSAADPKTAAKIIYDHFAGKQVPEVRVEFWKDVGKPPTRKKQEEETGRMIEELFALKEESGDRRNFFIAIDKIRVGEARTEKKIVSITTNRK